MYGDIGTSPLYVYSSTFPDGAPEDENRILGVFSMIFWTITGVVLLKYVILMLKADNQGEGGIIALFSIIKRAAKIPTLTNLHSCDEEQQQPSPAKPSCHWMTEGIKSALQSKRWLQIVLFVFVVLATNMIISDGVLTPAISVVSSVEGIKYNTDISEDAVVGISIAIVVVLFLAQPFGTQKISLLFSPIIFLWFASLASIGIYNVITYRPSAAKALSPHYIYYYWSGNASFAWKKLGAIMLSMTGAEALYADLGHFTANSIRAPFICMVYPALTLVYLGQTSYILENKGESGTTFWSSTPDSVYIPMVILATLAAIIASQALITGAFSIAQQGMAISCFPRFTVHHTNKDEGKGGQIYIPEVNFALMIGCILVIALFKNSVEIGNAYGLAIITVMVIDTFLLSIVMLVAWHWHPLPVSIFCMVYSFISFAYFSSNLEKIPHGAWFSVALVGILSIISFVYWWGQVLKVKYIKKKAVSFPDLFEPSRGLLALATKYTTKTAEFVMSASALGESERAEGDTVRVHPGTKPLRLVGTKLPVARLPGLGLYYSELLDAIPPSLIHFLSLSPAMHEVVVILTIRHVSLPRVGDEERLLVKKLDSVGIYHAVARYGYMEKINHDSIFTRQLVARLLEQMHGGELTPEGAFEVEPLEEDLKGEGKDIELGPMFDDGDSEVTIRGTTRKTQYSKRLQIEKGKMMKKNESLLPPPPPRLPIYRTSAEERLALEKSRTAEALASTSGFGESSLDLTGDTKKTVNEDIIATEQDLLFTAYSHGIVHLLGRVELRVPRESNNSLKRFVINTVYDFLSRNSKSASADYRIPEDNVLEMSVRYEV